MPCMLRRLSFWWSLCSFCLTGLDINDQGVLSMSVRGPMTVSRSGCRTLWVLTAGLAAGGVRADAGVVALPPQVSTLIGYGSPNKADTHDVHGAPLGKDETAATRKNLQWPYGEFEVRAHPAALRARCAQGPGGSLCQHPWPPNPLVSPAALCLGAAPSCCGMRW